MYCIAERVGETSVVLGQQCLIVLSHVPLLSIHEQVLRIWFDKQCDTVETRLKQHEKSNTFDDAFNDDNFVGMYFCCRAREKEIRKEKQNKNKKKY